MKYTLPLLLIAFAFGTAGAQAKKFTKQDSLKLSFCNCDSLYKAWPPKPGSKSDAPEFTGNGWNQLYNFQNKVGQCGYFSKFYFLYGLRFRYDSDGKLTQIQKYHNGKLVGTCEIKKK